MISTKTILAATDFSPLAGVALHTADHLGERLSVDHLHVIHVIRDPAGRSAFSGSTTDDLIAQVKADVQGQLTQLSIPPKPTITRTARVGIPAREIALEAGEVGADLIVVGSRGLGGMRRLILGSVAQDLVRVSPSPVLVVGATWNPSRDFKKVIAALDLSRVSESVLEWSVAFARAYHGAVDAISIFESAGTLLPADLAIRWDREALQHHGQALQRIVDGVPHPEVEVTAAALSDVEPKEAIITRAEKTNADLIVVGTSGRNAWQRMLIGSTTSRVLSDAPCPVLVIPDDGI
jgi:nucleotide-binding universal stress UspA family protein